jgi:hypothetical protein
MQKGEGANSSWIAMECWQIFDSHAERIFGLPPRQAQAEIGLERFWAELRSRPDYYRKLPLMPDAQRLFNAVKHLKPIILTGCPRGGWAEPQKQA